MGLYGGLVLSCVLYVEAVSASEALLARLARVNATRQGDVVAS